MSLMKNMILWNKIVMKPQQKLVLIGIDVHKESIIILMNNYKGYVVKIINIMF